MNPDQKHAANIALVQYFLHLEGLTAVLSRMGDIGRAKQIADLALAAVKTEAPSAIHGETLTRLVNESKDGMRVVFHVVDCSRIAWEHAVNGDPRI